MKHRVTKVLAAFGIAASLCLGGGTAYASSIDPLAVTPERTTRTINISSVSTGWSADGQKSLTSSSYGQATISRVSGATGSNPLQIAARNGSGNLQYPAEVTGPGQTVTYIRNTFGGTITFNPSMRATNSSISNIGGTWRYYEMP